jgi:hypothetical protein
MSNTIPNNVNIYQDTPNLVTVDQDAPNLVVVRSTSPTYADTKRLEFTQATAAATWVITHALGGKPQVTIVDSADTHVFGEVQYNSNTQVTVTFSAAFSGKAYLT